MTRAPVFTGEGFRGGGGGGTENQTSESGLAGRNQKQRITAKSRGKVVTEVRPAGQPSKFSEPGTIYKGLHISNVARVQVNKDCNTAHATEGSSHLSEYT